MATSEFRRELSKGENRSRVSRWNDVRDSDEVDWMTCGVSGISSRIQIWIYDREIGWLGGCDSIATRPVQFAIEFIARNSINSMEGKSMNFFQFALFSNWKELLELECKSESNKSFRQRQNSIWLGKWHRRPKSNEEHRYLCRQFSIANAIFHPSKHTFNYILYARNGIVDAPLQATQRTTLTYLIANSQLVHATRPDCRSWRIFYLWNSTT